MSGGDDDRHRQPLLLHFLDELHAVQMGHLQVGQDQAERARRQLLERRRAVGDGMHLDAVVGLQQLLQLTPRQLVIFDDQDVPLHGLSRSRLILGHLVGSGIWQNMCHCQTLFREGA